MTDNGSYPEMSGSYFERGAFQDFGVSKMAYELGRELDQLPPGDYVVQLHKPPPPQSTGWAISIGKAELVRRWRIGRNGHDRMAEWSNLGDMGRG